MAEIKSQIYEQFARLGKALANPGRIELLDLLSQGEKTVERLCQQSQLGVKNTSAQLKELKAAQLITSRREGKYIFYRVADDSVLAFIHSLKNQAQKQFPELERISGQHFEEGDTFAPLDKRSLIVKAKKGELILIDVRPSDEYQAGHLPSARSIPFDQLSGQIKTLPKDSLIVA